MYMFHLYRILLRTCKRYAAVNLGGEGLAVIDYNVAETVGYYRITEPK